MNWILDHLQLVIALSLGLAAWIKKIHTESAKRRVKRQTQMNPRREIVRPPAIDPAVGERTRQIQQEIRQKIEARTKAVEAQAAAMRQERAIQRSTREVFSPAELLKDAAPMPARPSSASRQFPGDFTASSRLRDAREDAARTDLLKSTSSDSIPPIISPIAIIPPMGNLLPASSWRGLLSDPEDVRRAIVLNEILRPPVGLR